MKVIPLYKMIVKEETDVSLAKKGNHEAFMTLIHTEKVKMYRIAKAMLRDETNIEDAMQATILKAYENIKKLNGPNGQRVYYYNPNKKDLQNLSNTLRTHLGLSEKQIEGN